jgi:plastocyanin
MTTTTRQRWVVRVAGASLVLLLAAYSGAEVGSGPSVSRTVMPSASHPRSDPPTSPSAGPLATHRGGVSACVVTPDAPPDATIEIAGRAFGPDVTVGTGAAVAFVNRDSTRHTVTEGIGGHADYDTACIQTRLHPHESTVVTFLQPGDYPITCTIHGRMQTVVHVR